MSKTYFDSNNLEEAEESSVMFTAENMEKLIIAHDGLRDLERFLTMLCGIDNENKILKDLRGIDYLLKKLSTIYDGNVGSDDQEFYKALKDKEIGLHVRACLLMGTREDCQDYMDAAKAQGGCNPEKEPPVKDEDEKSLAVPFTVKDMICLLRAQYAFRSLEGVLGLFAGTYPEMSFVDGLSRLCDLLENISPLYDPDYDEDAEENEEYIITMASEELSLVERAKRLMGL